MFGLPKRTVLKALNASERNCSFSRSRSLKSLKIERSQLRIPGARRSGELGCVLPKVNAAGCENTLVSK